MEDYIIARKNKNGEITLIEDSNYINTMNIIICVLLTIGAIVAFYFIQKKN